MLNHHMWVCESRDTSMCLWRAVNTIQLITIFLRLFFTEAAVKLVSIEATKLCLAFAQPPLPQYEVPIFVTYSNA